ncbi:MAG: TIGR03617 family F420-dependent LLM class oxidoreductase [Armatimonadota bacterium]|nr:TIGR03617 family F420-dependent LLM class oxidoreductase [Armatimonadota bacterium]MDR7588514.1 TIGR03617 family F420-dependent LLM class oxidoreductase [Armatimonadota bacterium]MDR7612655.1 TIGR03617 family F420-dependent LLM class oxidoreductase [Armatimonadota bacterium]
MTVRIDIHMMYRTLAEVPDVVRTAERLGVDGVWVSETAHDPFLGAALAAEHSARLLVGTGVAIAFTRSPTVLAHLAYDLAEASRGRFVLGLGTQVRAHIVRRYGLTWDAPAARLRDVVGAVRAVWEAWRTGAPLAYRGRYYTLTLMTPAFSPAPHPYPIPIMTAGVNPRMCQVAGEVADGFLVQPLHTRGYLTDVIRPALARGRARGGRPDPCPVVASVLVGVGESATAVRDAAARVRERIAFYASTPSYRRVLDHHGWGELGVRLRTLAARGAWAEMGTLIPDEILHEVAVVGGPEDVGDRLRERYRGLADRVVLDGPPLPGREDVWSALLDRCRA